MQRASVSGGHQSRRDLADAGSPMSLLAPSLPAGGSMGRVPHLRNAHEPNDVHRRHSGSSLQWQR